MSYSNKVMDHYEHPRNVGSFNKEDEDIGTGMVGAPACGDVMKLQIKVDEHGIIQDARFKTYGCGISTMFVNTPKGGVTLGDLHKGDIVFAWNGEQMVENTVKKIHKKYVPVSSLVKLVCSNGVDLIVTTDHLLWTKEGKPLEAVDSKGVWLLHSGGAKVRVDSIKPVRIEDLNHATMHKKDVVVYDISLEEGANVYFMHSIGHHNCGSAIASSSLITEWVKGKTLSEALTIKNTDIAEELALPPVKIHCSILAEDAIKAAVYDYQNKKKHE